MVQQRKGTCYQTWQSDPHDPPGRNRGLTSTNCPLTSTCRLWHDLSYICIHTMYTHTCTHAHRQAHTCTNNCNNNLKGGSPICMILRNIFPAQVQLRTRTSSRWLPWSSEANILRQKDASGNREALRMSLYAFWKQKCACPGSYWPKKPFNLLVPTKSPGSLQKK